MRRIAPVLSLAAGTALATGSALASATAPATAPYGIWTSPVSAEMTAGQSDRLFELRTGNGTVYAVEMQPQDGGRSAIMHLPGDGSATEVTPEGFNARNTVQEYGGADLLVLADGDLVAPDFDNQRLYRLAPDGSARTTLTPQGPYRWADCDVDAPRNRLICVLEDHTKGDINDAVNVIAAVPLDGSGTGTAPTVLFSGTDFVAAPAVSPDGAALAFLSWNHPNMPWDETSLHLADITADGTLAAPKTVTEGASVMDPQWGADGSLYYVSDASGWWNLYRLKDGAAANIAPMKAEFTTPLWTLDNPHYAIMADGTVIAAVVEDATSRLVRIPPGGAPEAIDTPFVSVSQMRGLDESHVVFIGYGTTMGEQVVKLSVADGAWSSLYAPPAEPLAAAYIATAQAVTFPTGADGSEVAHAFYYPPTNPDFTAPDGDLPPLIVDAHGGPTAHFSPTYSLGVQYWTSRGYAVMAVNTRGSSGFGTAFRNKLRGGWGTVDIEDFVSAARYAADSGLAHPDRLIIHGGSAGGFAVLAAHAFYDTFATGASYFGISDLTVLAEHTHKYESRYMDRLVAPWPQGREIYVARSPINHLAGMTRPLIFFQGLDDKVVPPKQSEMVVDALKKAGIEVEYHPYPGETHGFRGMGARTDSLVKERAFYTRILGLGTAE